MLENGCTDLFPFGHTSVSEVKALTFYDGILLAVPIARCLVGFRCELFVEASQVLPHHSSWTLLFCLINHGLQLSDIWTHLLACVLSFCTCRTLSASVRGENTNPWSVFRLLIGLRGSFWCFPYIWAMLAALEYKRRTPACISLHCSRSLL